MPVDEVAEEQALAERPALEAKLEQSRGIYSGRRLLTIRQIRAGDLYDRLGLRERDVLLLVDGEWVTDEENPLWRALEKGQAGAELNILVMRRGLPRSYRYRIE